MISVIHSIKCETCVDIVLLFLNKYLKILTYSYKHKNINNYILRKKVN